MLGNSEASVASTIDKLLNAMWRRGPSTHSFMTKTGNEQQVAIGICDRPNLPSIGPRFHGDLILALDGFFYDPQNMVRLDLHEPWFESLSGLLALPGATSFVATVAGQLFAGRDPVGQKPLYYGEAPHGLLAIASLRSALEAVGVRSAQPVSTGTILTASKGGFVSHGNGLERDVSTVENISEEDAVTEVGELFEEGISKSVLEGSGIAFSGGLDSSLVAAACKRTGMNPELVTVGVEGRPELEHAHRIATELEFPITIRELSPSEVIDSLGEVVAIVESTDPVPVCVSVPFYLACKQARRMGLGTILAGQLSDELFGGYARFEELALKRQLDLVESEIWNSVRAAPSNDFEPGDKVASALGLELRCPFAYLPLVKFALRLPTPLKVNFSGGIVVRKYVLRKLAERWGLPPTVVNRPKKAVQYSSGVQRVLEREARRRKLSLSRFLASYA